jgi:tetratricopeptide (TPR) repeat protein
MMRFVIYLVIAGVLAAAMASLPAPGRTALKQDTCFSDTVAADRRIAACSAAIRSARQGSSLKASALLNRAGAYGQKGEYGRAADDSSQAIREAPSAMAYYTRALAYHDLGEGEQAIRDCNEALAIDPKSENALFVRGAASQHLADYSGAIRDYSEVLRLDPGRADALFARGTANYSSGEYQAAVADFSKAIDLGYADATVFHLRELAESELGHRSDARSE